MPDMGRVTPPGSSITVDGGLCSYGFNYETENVYGHSGKIIGLDYYKIMAIFAGDDKPTWDQHFFARHGNACNVLWSDGSATTMPYRAIHPYLPTVPQRLWLKNP